MEGNHIVGDTNLTITINIPDDLKLVKSEPISGKCRVKNIVFDPVTGDTDVEYNETPEE